VQICELNVPAHATNPFHCQNPTVAMHLTPFVVRGVIEFLLDLTCLEDSLTQCHWGSHFPFMMLLLCLYKMTSQFD
jgi:hypothetical protein